MLKKIIFGLTYYVQGMLRGNEINVAVPFGGFDTWGESNCGIYIHSGTSINSSIVGKIDWLSSRTGN